MIPDINISDYVATEATAACYIKKYPQLSTLFGTYADKVAGLLCDQGPVKFTTADLNFIIDNANNTSVLEFSLNNETPLHNLISRLKEELPQHTNVKIAYCIITVNPDTAMITWDEISGLITVLDSLIDCIYWTYQYNTTLPVDAVRLIILLSV